MILPLESGHEQEGVIKYELHFQKRVLTETLSLDSCSTNSRLDALLTELNSCRNQLKAKGLIGQDPARYGGDGFGNISARLQDLCFIISGSQTGHLETLSLADLAVVNDFNIETNQLTAYGLTQPSSESMTHGVCFQASEDIDVVIHGHSPNIWNAIDRLGIPFTDQAIPYGTPQMASAVRHLLSVKHDSSQPTIFAMKGHEDGIVVVGQNFKICTASLLDCLNKSLL